MKKKVRNKAEFGRIVRHYRIRKNVCGTKERPRLSVHKSHKNLQAQLIDDISCITLVAFSTNDKEFKKDCKFGGNIDAARKFGAYVSSGAKKKGIEKIIFDRGGYPYHGRVKALADGAREAGLKF